MYVTNKELGELVSMTYYGEYEGRNDIESFINWLLEDDDGYEILDSDDE